MTIGATSSKIILSPIERWIIEGCYDTIWIDHPIDSNSNVVEFGGYKGRWSAAIAEKYNPNLFIYEPIGEFCEYLHHKLGDNPKVRIFNYGVSDKEETVEIYMREDSSSIHDVSLEYGPKNRKSGRIEINLNPIDKVISDIGKIDLCQMNIEGSEYDVLNSLFDSGKIQSINRIIIEFHFERDQVYVDKRKMIQDRFVKSGYRQIWNYDWAFECWEKI